MLIWTIQVNINFPFSHSHLHHHHLCPTPSLFSYHFVHYNPLPHSHFLSCIFVHHVVYPRALTLSLHYLSTLFSFFFLLLSCCFHLNFTAHILGMVNNIPFILNGNFEPTSFSCSKYSIIA